MIRPLDTRISNAATIARTLKNSASGTVSTKLGSIRLTPSIASLILAPLSSNLTSIVGPSLSTTLPSFTSSTSNSNSWFGSRSQNFAESENSSRSSESFVNILESAIEKLIPRFSMMLY
ncbi:hypothetical protein HK100_009685 [Physocladia obscura]|uniref:Uncharacterized protein n=1 Tax=Physocladia obscura TaxID=109957 RepID=A0AAD5T954_9FUNG|nr:hypothetical protein HK100_009685 [Physocladia obscura]